MRPEKQPATSLESFVDDDGHYNERPAPSVVLRHGVRALPAHLVEERLQQRRPRIDTVHDSTFEAERALRNSQIYELEGSLPSDTAMGAATGDYVFVVAAPGTDGSSSNKGNEKQELHTDPEEAASDPSSSRSGIKNLFGTFRSVFTNTPSQKPAQTEEPHSESPPRSYKAKVVEGPLDPDRSWTDLREKFNPSGNDGEVRAKPAPIRPSRVDSPTPSDGSYEVITAEDVITPVGSHKHQSLVPDEGPEKSSTTDYEGAEPLEMRDVAVQVHRKSERGSGTDSHGQTSSLRMPQRKEYEIRIRPFQDRLWARQTTAHGQPADNESNGQESASQPTQAAGTSASGVEDSQSRSSVSHSTTAPAHRQQGSSSSDESNNNEPPSPGRQDIRSPRRGNCRLQQPFPGMWVRGQNPGLPGLVDGGIRPHPNAMRLAHLWAQQGRESCSGCNCPNCRNSGRAA